METRTTKLKSDLTMDNTDLKEAIEEAYDDLYDEPRQISYWEIQREFETESLRETDILATVIDLACRDSQNDRDRRDLDAILRVLAPDDVSGQETNCA